MMLSLLSLLSRLEMTGKINFVLTNRTDLNRYHSSGHVGPGQSFGLSDSVSCLCYFSISIYFKINRIAIYFYQLNGFMEWKDLKFYTIILLCTSFNRCPESILLLHTMISNRMKYL